MLAALDLFDDQPTVGPFHAPASDTSWEAAERVRPTLAMRQAAVLRCLADFGPQTGEEIAIRLEYGIEGTYRILPRLSEMSRMDPPRVRKTAERRLNWSQSSATVWEAA